MPNKKRSYRGRRRSSQNLNKRIQSVLNKNLETKQQDLAISVSADTTGSSLNLLDIAQGLTQNTRVGNQVRMTGLYGRVSISAADTTNVVRVMLVIPYDKSDFLSSITPSSFIDQDKYSVLMDRLITVSTQGPAVKVLQIKKSFKRGGRKGIRVQYSGPLATDLSKNRMQLYISSDSGAVSHPAVEGNLRVYFKDA